MRLSTFTHDFLLLFAAPLVWALHFLGVYAIIGIACARPGAVGPGFLVAMALVAAAVAVAALVACLIRQPRAQAPSNRRFVRRVALGLALLALIAIAWETLAFFLVPACPAAT